MSNKVEISPMVALQEMKALNEWQQNRLLIHAQAKADQAARIEGLSAKLADLQQRLGALAEARKQKALAAEAAAADEAPAEVTE